MQGSWLTVNAVPPPGKRCRHGTTHGNILGAIDAEYSPLRPPIAAAFAFVRIPHLDHANESDINLLTQLGKRFDAVATVKAGTLTMPSSGPAPRPAANHCRACRSRAHAVTSTSTPSWTAIVTPTCARTVATATPAGARGFWWAFLRTRSCCRPPMPARLKRASMRRRVQTNGAHCRAKELQPASGTGG